MIRVAALELDPHVRPDRRHGEEPDLVPRVRHARLGPAQPPGAEHRGHRHLHAAALHRVDVVDDRPAVLAEERRVSHGSTAGTVDP